MLRALLAHSSDIIVVIGVDGAVRYWSDAARRILGYDRRERVTDPDIFEYIHPDDRELTVTTLADAFANPGVIGPAEARIAHGDGGWRDVEFIVTNRLEDPAIAGVVVSGHDVTDRKHAEEQTRALLEASPDLIFRIARDGTCLDYHAGSLVELAGPLEGLLGQRITDVLPADLAERGMVAIDEALRTGRIVEFEHATTTGPPRRFEIRISSINHDEALVISRDVTARTQAQERLRASEARHRAFLAAKPDLMLRLRRDGTFLDYHAADPAQLQMSPAEFLGRTLAEVMPTDVATRTMDAIETAITTGRMVEFEYSLEMPDQLRWYEARVGRIDDDEAVTICRDVTERKQAEEAVRTAERAVQELRIERERQDLAAKLEQSQRLESLGRLAGGVAHDFNNLLGVILNYTHLVEGALEADSEARDDLAHLRAAAQRGADLTHQLLLFGRPDTARPEVFDLRDLAVDVVGLLGRTLGPGIELVHRSATAPCPVDADRGRLDQVIVNLVLNARDAMPEGGRIEVETVPEVVSDHDAGRLGVAPGEYVVLRVRDTGSGMPPEVVARAFEPFFTTKPAAEGSGLGLSSVYGVVKASGGHVTIETEEARGTVVTVFLPISTPTSPARAETGAPDLARA